MGKTSTKPRGKAPGPYRRNKATGTDLVSEYSDPSIRKIILPRLSTSFFDQACRDTGTLNRRLILAMWYRSPALLSFSAPFFLTFFPARSSFAPFSDLAIFADPSSDCCWFTTASLASSSLATARFDRDQFTTSDGTEMKRLRLERAATIVSSSSDSPSAGMGLGSTRRIALSRPLR
jgi:hypothetical protein